MPAPTKRAKLESGPGDPYTAYMKALNQAKAKASLNWPWPAKPGVPSFPGLPPHSYPAPPPPPHTEFRRPEEVREAVVSREERYGDSPQPKQAKYAISPIEKVEPVEPVERFSQPALAEEISTVAEALAGAPKHATETVLKILERLTQRLDKAERDRDLAFGKYKELQTRYAQLEEELAKKRGELRELLRQDCRPPSPRPIDTEPAQKSRTNGAASVDDQSRGSSAEERGGGQGANLTVIVARLGEAGRLGEASSRSEGGEDSTAGKQDEAQPGSLPKVRTDLACHLLHNSFDSARGEVAKPSAGGCTSVTSTPPSKLQVPFHPIRTKKQNLLRSPASKTKTLQRELKRGSCGGDKRGCSQGGDPHQVPQTPGAQSKGRFKLVTSCHCLTLILPGP